MQIRFLDALCCPLTGQNLVLSIEEKIVVERNGGSGSSKLPGNPADEAREVLRFR